MAIFIACIPEGKDTNIEIRKWYNKHWTVIFRPTNKNIASNLASKMIEVKKNNNIIFNPYKKSQLFNYLKNNKWDFNKIKDFCYANNFALISCIINSIGIFINSELTYKNISQQLANTGRFNRIISEKYISNSNNLQVGDILVNDNDIALVVSYEEIISTPEQQNGNTRFIGTGIGNATIISKKAEIRNGAGQKYKIIDSIKKASQVEVLGITEDNWYKIVWPQSIAGYAYINGNDLIYKGQNLNSNIPKIVNYTVEVIIDHLKIQQGSDTSKPSLGVLKKGTKQKIIRERNNYGLLQSGKGWICLDGVKKV